MRQIIAGGGAIVASFMKVLNLLQVRNFAVFVKSG